MTAPHFDTEHVTVWHGDCIDVMRQMPDASVDAVVTDPPYGLEFMGKEWDSFKTYAGGNPAMKPQGANVGGDPSAASYGYRQKNPRCRNCGKLQRGNGACKCPTPSWDTRTSESAFQFQAWTEDWAAEALRVLKPGGHLLAFGGTRTFHRLTSGIEDAGFEIRDSIAWLYGSGFPKSLDVSKAIDKAQRRDYVIAAQALGIPLPARSIDDWTKEGHAPGDKWWAEFRAHLPAEDWQRIERAVIGTGSSGPASVAYTRTAASTYDVTAPATPAAARWQGWGTALKPAFEPIVVARKPLTGTVAANVLQHGTGALNIDASRIGGPEDKKHPGTRTYQRFDPGSPSKGSQVVPPYTSGRWPANVILDASQAAALDQQSGVLTSGALKPYAEQHENASSFRMDREKTYESQANSGGASRFFKTVDDVTPRFMYTAKAGSDERPGVDGVSHPTVKPVDLMRWLVRLVTPKDGTVLEPFAGSGTTVEAAVLEGFRCIAIEREADYLPLIMQRVSKPHAVGLDFDFETPVPAPVPTDNGRRGEASAARRYTEKGGTNFAPLPGRRRDERPPRPEPDPASGLDFGDWEDVS